MFFTQTISIPNDSFRGFRIGSLSILLVNQNDEWRYSSWLGETPNLPDKGHIDELSEDYDWIRWDNAEGDEKVQFTPAFPELPLIARPHGIINIPPKCSALFHIGIPASIKILAECAGDMTELANLPTQSLSKTWHGNQHKGAPCFALRTNARRRIEKLQCYTNDIICQVDVQNSSSEVTSFDRLYLETDHLAIYAKGEQLWASACRIKVKEAEEKFTRIIFSNTPLAPANDSNRLVEPAHGKTQKSSLFNVFNSFKDVLS